MSPLGGHRALVHAFEKTAKSFCGGRWMDLLNWIRPGAGEKNWVVYVHLKNYIHCIKGDFQPIKYFQLNA